MKHKKLIFWAYVSELILSVLLFGGLFLIWSPIALENFVVASAADLASYYAAIMLGGSLAFLWAFYTKSDTPFAQWLYSKGAFPVYAFAYFFAVANYALLTLALVIVKHTSSATLSFVALWLLIFCTLNAYSFLKNIYDQLRLNLEFNQKHGEMP